MKQLLIGIITWLIAVGASAQKYIDPQTPHRVLPQNTQLGTKWLLHFSDEFNGTTIDSSKWTIDNSNTPRAARHAIGIESWYWKPSNVSIANGSLRLIASKPNTTTMYCGSVSSVNKYLTTYGYFEVRMKIADAAKGTHTAFWLQGPNQSKVDGTGNDGAEIDVVESAWVQDFTKSVIHIDGYVKGTTRANTIKYDTPGIHDGGFHTWGLWWTPDFLKIYYDGELKVTYNDKRWVPQVDEFLWLSNGASFGFPDNDPCFRSQPMGYLTHAEVDYIRVWKSTDN